MMSNRRAPRAPPPRSAAEKSSLQVLAGRVADREGRWAKPDDYRIPKRYAGSTSPRTPSETEGDGSEMT